MKRPLARVSNWSVPLRLYILSLSVLLLIALAFAWLWTPDKNRAELEALYLRAPADMLHVLGQRLHVRDVGRRDVPAVILLHGFGSSLQTWDAWADDLAQDHRVVRLDMPGCGLSEGDVGGDYTDVRGMQLLVALMDQLGIAKASLVGHSIGGRLAWRFAAAHPDRVEKLVLVSPDGFASPGFEYGKNPEVPAMLKLVRYALPKALLKMSLAPAYASPQVMTDALVTRYHDLLLAPGVRDAMLARMAQTVLVDPRPLLASIRAPTLLLWGDKDPMIPVANAEDYLKAMPRATLARLPAVGHVPQEEAPQSSLAVVRDFLR